MSECECILRRKGALSGQLDRKSDISTVNLPCTVAPKTDITVMWLFIGGLFIFYIQYKQHFYSAQEYKTGQ